MRLPNGYGSVTRLKGNRRKPYIVRKTIGWHYDSEKDKQIQDTVIIGYAKTKTEGMQMLADYNEQNLDMTTTSMTFQQVYKAWSSKKFPNTSKSNADGLRVAYESCEALYKKRFIDLKLSDLQSVIDNCQKNYPSLMKIRSLFSQLYGYAIKNDICSKNYAKYVDVIQYKDRNPNKLPRDRFTKDEIDRLWKTADNEYTKIILILLYSGVRICELLYLKKQNVHVDEHYFDVLKSKTPSGIRRVPISDKTMPFFKELLTLHPSSEYLVNDPEDKPLAYHNYLRNQFRPCLIPAEIPLDHTPHWARHTCNTMMAEAGVDQVIRKKILGHSRGLSITDRYYTHFDMEVLVEAINKI